MTTISLELTVEQERALSQRATECGFQSIDDYLRMVIQEQTVDVAFDAAADSESMRETRAELNCIKVTPEFFDGLRKRLADRLSQMA